MKRRNRMNPTLAGSVLIGVGASIIITAAAIALGSKLMLRQTVGEGSTAWIVGGVSFLSTLAGCVTAGSMNTEGKMKTIIITAGVFSVLLLTVGMLMDGTYDGVLWKMGLIAAGGLVSCVICRKKRRIQPLRKRYSR